MHIGIDGGGARSQAGRDHVKAIDEQLGGLEAGEIAIQSSFGDRVHTPDGAVVIHIDVQDAGVGSSVGDVAAQIVVPEHHRVALATVRAVKALIMQISPVIHDLVKVGIIGDIQARGTGAVHGDGGWSRGLGVGAHGQGGISFELDGDNAG